MKVTLTLLITATVCFQSALSFFGNDINYPPANKLTTACTQATTSMKNIPVKITQIQKVTVKFNRDEFALASSSFADLNLYFSGYLVFLAQIGSFLNDPPVASPEQVIGLQIYNAQLLETASTQIASAAENIGAVFGETVKSAIEAVITKITQRTTDIRESLEILQENFASIFDNETPVTIEVLDEELDAEAIATFLAALQDINVASKQMVSMCSNLVTITKALDKVSSSVQTSYESTKSTISSLTFTLNIEAQNARSQFSQSSKNSMVQIFNAFATYSETSLKVFGESSIEIIEFLNDQQASIDDFTAAMDTMFTAIQDQFSTSMRDYYAALYESIAATQKQVDDQTTEVKEYLAQLVVENGGQSFKDCFVNADIQSQATQIIKKQQSSFVSCVNTERSTAAQTASIMSFRLGDVVLNMEGAADSLCACSVKGGKKVTEQTKECIEGIVGDLEGTVIKDDEDYLNNELNKVAATLEKSETRFAECTANMTETFNEEFDQFKQASITCLASFRSLRV